MIDVSKTAGMVSATGAPPKEWSTYRLSLGRFWYEQNERGLGRARRDQCGSERNRSRTRPRGELWKGPPDIML